LYVSMD